MSNLTVAIIFYNYERPELNICSGSTVKLRSVKTYLYHPFDSHPKKVSTEVLLIQTLQVRENSLEKQK